MSWQGVTALVTGADGFIGSHLTEALVRAGADVRAFCFYTSNGSLGCLEDCAPEIRERLDVRLGDVRDARVVEQSLDGADVVFHLAALIAVPYSYRAPESFVDTNVRGTLNVLEAVRRRGCRRLVHVSTSEVYGTPDTLPITEDHPLKAQSPYSATKIAADKLAEAYCRSFGVPVVTIRPFNTYGPRQSMRAVVPTILSQLIAGRAVVQLGSTAPRRDLTFVSDTVAALCIAGLAPDVDGQVIHLGTGRAHSVAEIFEAAKAVCGVDARAAFDPERARPDGSEVLVLESNPARAAQLLGWRATVSLESGLLRTAEWIRAYAERARPDLYAV